MFHPLDASAPSPPSLARLGFLLAGALAPLLGGPVGPTPQEEAQEPGASGSAMQDGETGVAGDREPFGPITPPPGVPARDLPTLPISLEAALTLAETNNLGLQMQDLATEVARFNAIGAWGTYDWVLGANAGYTDFERKPSAVVEGLVLQKGDVWSYDLSLTRALETGGSFSALFDSNRTTTTSQNAFAATQIEDQLSFTLTQPLLRGVGYDRATADQREAELQYMKQVEARRQTQQELLRDTANAYWDLVQSRNQLGVAESSLELGRQQLERNQRLLSAGVGTEVEVIQAEAEVARREETRLLAYVTLLASSDALKALLFPGKDPESWNTELVPTTPVPDDVGVEELAAWEDALDVAFDRRPELRQQDFEIRIAKLRHERTISDRRYGLDLNLQAISQGLSVNDYDSFREAFDFEHMTYVAGLNINAPVQNRTAASAERAALLERRSAQLMLDQLHTQVVGEVRDAVRQLHYQSLAVRAAGESLRAADRQLAAEEARYENDLSTNFQVLEFQMQLVEAMNSEQTARVNFAKALFQLRAAQGTLGERP